jgi:hypothetical protein
MLRQNPTEQWTNSEGQECKTGHVKGRVLVGMGRVNEKSKGGWIWLRYFLYMYEYGTLKPTEVILRRGMEWEGEGMNKTGL